MKENGIALLKMIDFEIHRLKVFLLSMAGLVAVSNFYGTYHHIIRVREQSAGEALRFDLTQLFASSALFFFPVLFCMAGLSLYVLFTWYREWFGKNTFIYRLMMLPYSRLLILFSKLISLIIGILSIVAFQHIILAICEGIARLAVPEHLIYRSSFVERAMNDGFSGMVLGGDIRSFLVAYTLGALFILCVFTGILLERSYGIPGILLGITLCLLYPIFSAGMVALPYLLGNPNILYASEVAALFILFQAIILIGTVYLSRYLLNHKLSI